jgi:hypothetical protein
VIFARMRLSQSRKSTHCPFPNILHRLKHLIRNRMELINFLCLLAHPFQRCNRLFASMPMAL